MKKIALYFLFAFLAFHTNIKAQLNMTLLSQIEYNVELNDIWGWAASDGTEYALVGVNNGVSIVSLADPNNAQEVVFIPGQNSIWRDIKTWGNFAYVTTDQSGTTEGVTVIDLSNLPASAPYYHWTPNLPGLGMLNTCHNLYIDEFGYCYLAGCNVNNGGMLILNVDTATGEPEFVAPAPNIYSHDVYTVSNKMFASEIYLGRMAIYDVSNKNSIQLLGSQGTPFAFTHNIWVNEEETVAFTTDERANAPVAAYDITNLSDIVELDQYRPITTLGNDVIPHNVHVWDNWLLISYYTDGGRVVDASRPNNLIEVANYDTFLGGDGGFSGAWGLYPFLPSGNVLVSDINNGLFVCGIELKRACWLEGVVVDSLTGALLNGVEVIIDSGQDNLGTTDALGKYATGQVLDGTFTVSYSKPGYQSKMHEVVLANGVLTVQDVELAPLGSFSFSGQAIRDEDGQAVPGAQVVAIGDFTYSTTTDANGNFTFVGVAEGNYEIVAGAWGYLHESVSGININEGVTDPVILELEIGYQDDFVFDFDWTTQVDGASSGAWTRGEPNGTYRDGVQVNPEFDAPNDLGVECYVTGNIGITSSDDDVDNGTVTLNSPVMDLSGYQDPVLSFRYWFHNDGGNSTPNDALVARISNGTQEVEIGSYTQSLSIWRPQSDIHLKDLIALTNTMTLTFETGDLPNTGHLVEAGVDEILILDDASSQVEDTTPRFGLEVAPNPFAQQFYLKYQLNQGDGQALIRVMNALGQQVEARSLTTLSGTAEFGQQYLPGVYWISLEINGQALETLKVVKTK